MFTHKFTSAIFLIVSQLLKSVHTFGKGTSKKLNFCHIRVIILLQSYVIMPVGRLQGTEIKTEYLLA